jgi:ADP-ribose pyrophosphatase
MQNDHQKKLTFNHNDYEIVKREVLYDGVFRLVRNHIRYRLFDGDFSKVFTREVLERTSAAAVLPYDPYSDQVVLIEQFRPGAIADPTSPWMTEIVAGVIENNETPEQVAIREAEEEAGCKIQALYHVNDYFASPSCITECLYLFLGKIDASTVGGIHGLDKESENIRAYALPADEAFEKVRAGYIKTSPAIITLQWLQLNRHLLQALWIDQIETK